MIKTAHSIAHVYFYSSGDENRGFGLAIERMNFKIFTVV